MLMRTALLTLLLMNGCLTADKIPTATHRAKEFLENIHTGKDMTPEEWMTREARNAPAFQAFGGLPRMVKNSTAWANKYGGLRDIELLHAKTEREGVVVAMRIHLQRDYRDPASPVASEREDRVWELRLAMEDGAWKIAP